MNVAVLADPGTAIAVDLRDLSPVKRGSMRDMGHLPMDPLNMLDALIELPPRVYKALHWLRFELLRRGELPASFRKLADFARVSLAAFTKMAPVLNEWFARDEQGRWTDPALVEARGARAVLPTVELDETKPKNPKRQAAGAWNVLKRYHPDLFDENGKLKAGKELTAQILLSGIANGAMKDGKSAALTIEGSLSGVVTPSSAESQLVGSEPPIREKITTKLTDSASDREFGNAAGPEPSKAVPVEPNGKAVASDQVPSDATIVDAVVRKCGTLVKNTEVHRRLPVFRALMSEGVGFFEDILPAIEAFARGKTQIDNCANTHILRLAAEHFESRKAVAALPQGKETSGTVRIYRDSPEGEAFIALHGASAKFALQDNGRWYRTERRAATSSTLGA